MDDDATKFGIGEENDGANVAAKAKDLERALAESSQDVEKDVQRLESFGTKMTDAKMLPLMNRVLQDRMAKLGSLITSYEMNARQYPSEERVQAGMRTVQEWKDQFQLLRMSSRNATLQAKKNIDQAVVNEREQLLSGGQDVDRLHRQLETQAGMASSAERITDGLRLTLKRMSQEVERNAAASSLIGHYLTWLRVRRQSLMDYVAPAT